MRAKNIAKTFDFTERMECLTINPDLISQKPQRKFSVQLTWPSLLHLSKSELGKVSHVSNQVLAEDLDVNQLKNSSTVVEWFKKEYVLKGKHIKTEKQH